MKFSGKAIEILGKVTEHLAKQGEESVDVEVKKTHHEKRSLDANAYLHVLIDKIAKELRVGMDEVKHRLVCDYGSTVTYIRLPADVSPEQCGITYYRQIGEAKGTSKPCIDYIVYKPTHEMDRAEMARLIDSTVVEAKDLGIETRTPDEIANMLSLWEKANEKK